MKNKIDKLMCIYISFITSILITLGSRTGFVIFANFFFRIALPKELIVFDIFVGILYGLSIYSLLKKCIEKVEEEKK